MTATDKMSLNLDEQAIRYYLSLVGHKIQILNRKLDGFQSKGYPNSYSVALIKIMKRILTQSFDELDRLNDRIGEMENSDIADRAWLIPFFAIRYLSRWMEAIEIPM